MAKINFKKAFREARKSPAYWTERAILDYTTQLATRLSNKGLTQHDLAQMVDTSDAYISKVLGGSPNLTIKSMVELAHAVGMNVNISLSERLDELDEMVPWTKPVQLSVRTPSVIAQDIVVELDPANELFEYDQIELATA